MTDPALVVLRPVPQGAPRNDTARAIQEHHALVVDPQARTLTWLSDRAPAKRTKTEISDRVMGLPGSGVAPEAASVMLVSDSLSRGEDVGLLIVADKQGRVLVRERQMLAKLLPSVWPHEELDRLRAFGLTTGERHFSGAHKTNQAYPGSRPTWLLTSPLLALVVFLGVFVLIAVIALLMAV